MRLRLSDPLPKPKEIDQPVNNASFDGGVDMSKTATSGASTFKMVKKKLGPDVLVPCRYEDVNTLTALLPPFPLRGVYLTALNKRKKPKNNGANIEKWPKPWPSISCFQVDVVMASDDGKLLKLWENKLANGVEAPVAITSSVNGNNNNTLNTSNLNVNNEMSSSTNEENALIQADHLKVFSLPGMLPSNQGLPSFNLNVGSGGMQPGKLVELSMLDHKFTLFDASKTCLVRFAFTNQEGTKFIRDSKKLMNSNNSKQPSSQVASAQAALTAAQASLDENNDEDEDESIKVEKMKLITKCEEELALAIEASNNENPSPSSSGQSNNESSDVQSSSNTANKKNSADWFVDVPALVEEVNYIPETSKIPTEKKNKKNNNNSSISSSTATLKKRWVIRCRAPGLKKKNNGGGIEFDTSHASLSTMNNQIVSALYANQNASRRRKSYKETDSIDLANQLAHTATFGDDSSSNQSAASFGRTYARVFVSLNGIHFHDWPTNALTQGGDPPAPFEDKTADGTNTEPTPLTTM